MNPHGELHFACDLVEDLLRQALTKIDEIRDCNDREQLILKLSAVRTCIEQLSEYPDEFLEVIRMLYPEAQPHDQS